MNKTVVIVFFFVLLMVGVMGGAAIAIFRPDASATFMGTATLILGMATLGAANLYSIDKTEKHIGEVKETNKTIAKNVNGNLTALIEAISTMSAKSGIPAEISPEKMAEIKAAAHEMRLMAEKESK